MYGHKQNTSMSVLYKTHLMAQQLQTWWLGNIEVTSKKFSIDKIYNNGKFRTYSIENNDL